MNDSPHPSPPRPPAAPTPEVADDAATQALSEALRSSFAILKIIMIGLVVVFLMSGVKIVEQQNKAIILRFGKPVGEDEKAMLGPGLHWAFPYPIDEVVQIPVGQVQTVNSSIGWYATSAANEAAGTEAPAGPTLNPATDGYLMSGDGNIIHARATLRYRITEPGIRYTFAFTNASALVQNALNNALLYAAASTSVDDILTRDVAGFRDKARALLDQLIARQGLGITVDLIDNLQVIAPRQVATNFNAVTAASQRRGQVLNEARSYENQTVSKAQGEAAARLNTAEADRARLVDFVAAEVERFTNNLPAYRANADLFVRQHQAETLQRVLAGAQDKMVLPGGSANGKPLELRLQLNREPEKPKTLAPPPDDHH
ncbi:MAG TPA: protease modulator HflK [Verrucomicrobiae bacterium]